MPKQTLGMSALSDKSRMTRAARLSLAMMGKSLPPPVSFSRRSDAFHDGRAFGASGHVSDVYEPALTAWSDPRQLSLPFPDQSAPRAAGAAAGAPDPRRRGRL